MKITKKQSGCVLFLLMFSFPIVLLGQDFRAAYVDFMYVPEGMSGAYVTMEQEIAKPVHQEAINQGRMVSWSLWAIPFPGGTEAEYHYATVRIYENMEQIKQAGEFGSLVEKVHAGEDIDELITRVWETRDLVKTHRLYSWERFLDEDLTEPPGLIQVVYFDVPGGGQEAYQQMERNLFHPLHKREIEIGKRAGWEGWSLNQPYGSSMPYNYVAVDMYVDMDQFLMDYDYDAMFEEVHPDKTSGYLSDTFYKTVDMVRVEQWELVDYVQVENP